MPEQLDPPASPEAVSETPSIRIIIQRHGETDRTRPKADDPEAVKERAGWLTSTGVATTRAVARSKAEEILSEHKPVTFFFINSPSSWFSEGVAYGRRAEQTAQVSAEEIQSVINEKGLSPEVADIHQFGIKAKSKTTLHDTPAVAEPDLYFVPGAKHPTAYIEALRAKYGKDWEEGFHKIEEDLEEIRNMTGAQSSEELGQATLRIFRAIERYAKKHADIFSGRELVFWIDTHGDRLRSVAQYGLGLEEKIEGHLFKENELLDLTLENGVVKGQFKDQEFSKDLND